MNIFSAAVGLKFTDMNIFLVSVGLLTSSWPWRPIQNKCFNKFRFWFSQSFDLCEFDIKNMSIFVQGS